ncbi:MAG TPA: MmcQ/YjbR family DNA-binding protein [Solirubrobacteraceae bacterium]|nr:MmcQ/YjbR family DNA-binding protein [Solirubrobacteraceae bacterium]
MGAGIAKEQAADAALSLPGSVEADHHGRRSFRVGGAIFATLWDETHMNVMLDEPGIRTAVQAHPEACAEFWWGRRLRAVQVDLRRARPGLISELLADAWERRAGRPRG